MPSGRDRCVWIMSRIVAPILVVVILIISLVYITASSYQGPQEQIGFKRVYYIAAVDVIWDYAPGVEVSHGQKYVERHLSKSNNPPRIGRSYQKAVFRQYTDDTYQTESSRPEWLGILGPLIVAEIGEQIEVRFLNNASIPASMHPHGLSYTKSNEGAYYQDNTPESQKLDDAVPPGGRYIYKWSLPEFNAPTSSDSDCLTMTYHSHHRSDVEIHMGLIGPLLICKRDSLRDGVPKDANQTIFLLFLIFDENQSLYLDKNINDNFPSMNSNEVDELKEDDDFMDSNRMYSINGIAFDALKGLDFCVGERISWRLIGMGNEIDLHSVTFQHHLIMINGHRTNVVSLAPAKFSTSYMTARKPGKWKVLSETGNQFLAGMTSHFTVQQCESSPSQNSTFAIPYNPRTYYLAVELVEWNYAPSGVNKMTNETLISEGINSAIAAGGIKFRDASFYFGTGPDRIGGTYKKALYVQYEDSEFKNKVQRPAEDLHLGFLGPTLRVEEGEAIQLVIKNNADRPYSIYSPGVESYNQTGKIVYDDNVVEPGSTSIFYWYVPEYYAPSKSDPQCLTWRYYSTVDFIKDAYSGLNGVVLTCKRGTLDEAGKQKNVDKEFSLLFAIINENESHYLQNNVDTYCGRPETVNLTDPGFKASNSMNAINGRMYGNLEGLTMSLNDTVSWHIIAMGNENDIHTAYFHGQVYQQYGVYRDTLALFPSTHHTVYMTADNVGEWELECKTMGHHLSGMRAIYEVRPTNQTEITSHIEQGKIRRYYLAAVEKEWNYAPNNTHIITGENLTENEESEIFVTRGDHRIGRVYKKVIYELYADENFTVPVEKPPHLGVMGPMIKAEVDDVIEIVFKNIATDRSYSLNLHGVVATSEMTPTAPNETRVYSWKALKRSGPGGSEFNCASWSYYSDVDVVRDVNSGLIGPLVVCRKGTLDESGKRRDIDHEFALLFAIFNENVSWFLRDNIGTYCGKPEEVNWRDPDFWESNVKHGINGRLYGSLEGLEVRLGDRVAWYLLGMANDLDIHTVHIHGITFVSWKDGKRRGDVVELSPGIFETVEMRADNVGSWLLHCHVDDHVKAGMNALFIVKQ